MFHQCDIKTGRLAEYVDNYWYNMCKILLNAKICHLKITYCCGKHDIILISKYMMFLWFINKFPYSITRMKPWWLLIVYLTIAYHIIKIRNTVIRYHSLGQSTLYRILIKTTLYVRIMNMFCLTLFLYWQQSIRLYWKPVYW